MDKIKILYSPVHYILDSGKIGSEYGWASGIFKNCSSFENISVSAICAYSNLKPINDSDIIEISKFKKINLNNIGRLVFVFKVFFATKNILKKQDIDIIHHVLPFAYGATFNLAAILGLFKNKKFVIGPVQTPLTYESKQEFLFVNEGFEIGLKKRLLMSADILSAKLFRPLLFELSKRTLNKADVIVAINEDSKKYYSNIVDENKIIVVPPGIDVSVYKEKDFKPIDGDKCIEIITASHLIKRKGVDLIINAISGLPNKYQDRIILKIIGDGPEKKYLEELVYNLKLNNIYFEGYVKHEIISKYYQNADIFISMSYSESFGQVLIEAMDAGLPSIVSKVSGFKGILAHGTTGFLINHDVEELKKYLIELIDNPQLRNEMGLNARQIVEEKYDWKIIANEYYEMYQNLIL
ncbi:glycosyltransferase [Methanococcoides sp. LMO-2]|uniref:Glycosyltransferase n=1 Tax=Methanococcoides cohabitans TaxID=3136559 RepID=A0ABU9KQA6_9EURY